MLAKRSNSVPALVRLVPARRSNVRPSEPRGVPINFNLDHGDVIVLSGEQQHSSKADITDEARYVSTVRFTVGGLRYRDGVGWIAYHDTRLLDGPLRHFASLSSRLTISHLRHGEHMAHHRMAGVVNQSCARLPNLVVYPLKDIGTGVCKPETRETRS